MNFNDIRKIRFIHNGKVTYLHSGDKFHFNARRKTLRVISQGRTVLWQVGYDGSQVAEIPISGGHCRCQAFIFRLLRWQKIRLGFKCQATDTKGSTWRLYGR